MDLGVLDLGVLLAIRYLQEHVSKCNFQSTATWPFEGGPVRKFVEVSFPVQPWPLSIIRYLPMNNTQTQLFSFIPHCSGVANKARYPLHSLRLTILSNDLISNILCMRAPGPFCNHTSFGANPAADDTVYKRYPSASSM